MLAIDFVPGEIDAAICQGIVNQPPAPAGNVGILPAPQIQHFSGNFADPVQGIIGPAEAQTALVDIRGITTNPGINVRQQGGAGGQMPSEADAHRADFPGARRMGFQIPHGGSGIRIVGREGAGGLVGIPPVGPGGILGQHGAGFLQIMIDFRHRNHKSMSRQ